MKFKDRLRWSVAIMVVFIFNICWMVSTGFKEDPPLPLKILSVSFCSVFFTMFEVGIVYGIVAWWSWLKPKKGEEL